jgi:hypothetical protein
MRLPGPAFRALCAASLLLLGGCESLDLDMNLDLFGGDEAAPVPRMAAAPLPVMPPPPPAPPPAPVLTPDMPVAEIWAAERAADRFATLHRLVLDALLEPRRYESWARDNEGAFLLLTAPPPVKGLAAKIPSYEEVAAYLRKIKQDRADVAAAERAALLDSLMPAGGPRAAKMRPPAGKDLERWIALLDRLAALGALPADKVAAEKSVLALIGASAP